MQEFDPRKPGPVRERQRQPAGGNADVFLTRKPREHQVVRSRAVHDRAVIPVPDRHQFRPVRLKFIELVWGDGKDEVGQLETAFLAMECRNILE